MAARLDAPLTLRLGLFSSGQDDTAHDVLRWILRMKGAGALDVSFTFAFCAWEEKEAQTPEQRAVRGRYLDLVRSLEIPLVMLSAQGAKERSKQDAGQDWRCQFGRQMRRLLYERAFELGVLDGRMVVDEDTCVRFDLVGLCHSLPDGPRGEPEEVLRQVLRARPKAHGVMTRVCTGKRENVSPLTYCTYPLAGGAVAEMWQELDTLAKGRPLDQMGLPEMRSTRIGQHILREGGARAPPLVTYTIKLFADGDLDIVNGRPMVDGANLASPIDLTRKVDAALSQAQL